MTTRETVLDYFKALQEMGKWQDFLAEALTFTNHAFPVREVTDKAAYLEATKGFFAMVTGVEVREVLTDGDRACALTRYNLKPPLGDAFSSDVAEILTVADGKITSLGIYFDSAPFPGSIDRKEEE